MTFQPDAANVSAVVPSPNYTAGRGGHAITAIVVHGTAGPGAVSWFADTVSQVSAHYVIDTDGRVTQTVREDNTAWHAGVVTPSSTFAGNENPNKFCIGIEHVRNQSNTSPLTTAQQVASIALIRDIRTRRGPLALIPHDLIDVGRVCPGAGFPLDAIDNAATLKEAMMHLDITPVNQNNATPRDDGGVDESQDRQERGLDCGEGCVAMGLRWATGRSVTVDEIHDAILRAGTVSYSYVGQLSAYLNTQGVNTHYVNITDAEAARVDALAHIASGKPVICLLFWDRVVRTGGHFVLGLGGTGQGGVVEANPWGGFIETLSPAAWWQAYNGWLLFIDSPAHSAPASPPSSSSSSGPSGSPGGATGTPTHFRMLFDGALHSRPDAKAPITTHVKKGDILTAVAGESKPWCSVRTAHGVWGWNLASSMITTK